MSVVERPDLGPVGPRWMRRLSGVVGRLLWDIEVVGADRVPVTGPVVLAANHVGVLDGPLVHAMAPRPSHILVKSEMFHGFLGLVLRSARQIPVDRASSRSGLEAARAVLLAGGVVGIFPEGNRGRGDGASVRAGVAWLAVQAGAPVVPVAVLGTRLTGESTGRVPRFRQRMVIEFGAPVPPQRAAAARDSVRLTAEAVGRALAEHVADAADRHGMLLPQDGPDVVV